MKINRLVSAFILIPVCFSNPLRAETASLQMAISRSPAIVSIDAIEAGIYGSKPQGVLDQTTGQILIIQKARRVAAKQHGTGIILDSSGIIVTNTHTVRSAPNIFVTLFDGTRAPAKILYHAPKQDISFIKIEPPFALQSISFANSDTLTIGMSVYAVGSAQRTSGTVTGGKIKSLGKEKFHGASRVTQLQITFRSYKGDSGSPILDGHGNLVGMISAGQTRGNITYAISSNLIKTCYRDYLNSLQPPANQAPEI